MFLLPTCAFSSDWYHQKLELVSENRKETIQVSVDYRPVASGGARYQKPAIYSQNVHVNVWVTGQKRAGQVFLKTYEFNRYHGLSFEHYLSDFGRSQLKEVGSQIIHLTNNGYKLTGVSEEPVYITGSGYGKRDSSGIQEIAVVIDGVWYKGWDGQNALFSLYENMNNQ